MRKLYLLLGLVFMLTFTAVIVFAPAQTKIEFELNVSQDVNVTFNGKVYQLLYEPTTQYKCLAKEYGNFTHPECYYPPKNVTLNKDTIQDITSATYIVIDRSYLVQQGQKIYQINFIQRNITNCIAETPHKISECIS